jgi:hypothetical protein
VAGRGVPVAEFNLEPTDNTQVRWGGGRAGVGAGCVYVCVLIRCSRLSGRWVGTQQAPIPKDCQGIPTQQKKLIVIHHPRCNAPFMFASMTAA